MNFNEKMWIKNFTEQTNSLSLSEEFNISPKISEFLVNKGYDSEEKIREFLYPNIENLYDPFQLEGMTAFCDRVKNAIEHNENIWIYGDYDVDGITSTSILIRYFKHVGVDVSYYIPDRTTEGYGINKGALDQIKEQGGNLTITVDCGITSVDEAEYAKAIGLDLIITDHHNCQAIIPDAYCVINPKKASCQYPFDMLAGVGIAFKLVQALSGDQFMNFYEEIIDLAAFGTIADIAPLKDENRIISKHGLKVMETTNNIGLRCLIEESGLKGKELNAGHVGFMLAPRINASGRIADPKRAVTLFTTESYELASEIAKELTDLNTERQEREQVILQEAIAFVEEHIDLTKEKILVVKGENWHSGIVGIVASRISEKYYKPSIVLREEDGVLKGSARSVGSFNIFEAMNECKDLFAKFGGHEQAAGVSLASVNYDAFRKQINSYADQVMTHADLVPQVKVDGELTSVDISYKFLDDLEMLKPHGIGNAKPVFSYRDLIVDRNSLIGKDKTHCKMVVHDGTRVFDSLMFGCGDKYSHIRANDRIDMVFNIEKKEFRGVETIQFMLKDVRTNVFRDEQYKDMNRELSLVAAERFVSNVVSFSEETLTTEPFEVMPFNDVLDIIRTIGPDEKVLYVTDQIESVFDLEREMGKIYFNDYTIHSGSGRSRSEKIQIILNPDYEQLEEDDFDVLIVDAFCSNGHLNKVIDLTKRLIVVPEGKKDEKAIVPNRDKMAMVYKFLMKAENNRFDLLQVSEKLNLSYINVLLSLEVFQQLELIKKDKKGKDVNIIVCERPKERIDIVNSDFYKKANRFFEDYYAILGVNK